jgi:hypothetical protein
MIIGGGGLKNKPRQSSFGHTALVTAGNHVLNIKKFYNISIYALTKRFQ